jgi:dihydrolipoamide dehydrogenase
LSVGHGGGFTEPLFESGSRLLVGAAMVGVGAGELIAEAVLAPELSAVAVDLCVAVHPHPTRSETLAMAAEIAEGSVADIYLGRT